MGGYDGEYDAGEYPDGYDAPRFGYRASSALAEQRTEVERLKVLLYKAEKHLRAAGGWAHISGQPVWKGDPFKDPERCSALMPVDGRCTCGLYDLLNTLSPNGRPET